MSPSGHNDPGNQPRPDGAGPPPQQRPQQPSQSYGQPGQPGPTPQRPPYQQPPAQPPSQGPPNWAAEPPPPGRPRRRFLWVGAGAAALVVVAAAIVFAVLSSQPDIQTEDGEVTNAERFLGDVRDQWRTQLPTDNINLGEDPACYYVVDDGSDEVTGVIACGGVRRLQSNDGEVWDIFSYDVHENANGESVASSAQQVESSVDRPDGKLLTASGDEASDEMADLAAPDLPTAESGLLRYGDGVGLDSLELTDVKRPEGTGTVITPGGRVTIQSVATAPYVMSASDTGSATDSGEDTADDTEAGVAHQAADGEMFRVITYTFEASENDDSEGTTTTTVMLDAGKQQTEIGPSDSYSYDDDQAQQHVIASVPESAKAELVVASAGHEQRVDLSTGRRQPDPVTDAYYRDIVQQDIAKTFDYPDKKVRTGIDPDDYIHGSYVLELESARITPYEQLGDLGWADKGKVWLTVSYNGEFASEAVFPEVTSTSQSWTATVGNKTYQSRTVHDTDSWDSEMVATFAVPSDLATAKLEVKTDLTVQGYPTSQNTTLHFGPSSVTVKFPK